MTARYCRVVFLEHMILLLYRIGRSLFEYDFKKIDDLTLIVNQRNVGWHAGYNIDAHGRP